MAQIHEAIVGLLTDVEHISKGKKNTQQGYNFRGIDDVYNTIHPLFAKHGVYPTCKVIGVEYQERETKNGSTLFYARGRFEYTFHAKDGSCVSSEAVGEAMDSGDKASNKAMSNAYKYAIFQMLCIPTEAVDGDNDTYTEVKPPKTEFGKPTATTPPVETSPAPKTWEQMTSKERADKTLAGITKATNNPDPKVAQAELGKINTWLASKVGAFDDADGKRVADMLAASNTIIEARITAAA